MNAGTETRPRSQESESLWRQYQASGDSRIRDRLVMNLAPLVKYIVSRKLRSIPAHLDADDFISCGLLALIGAIERWDPARGATLEQYVWPRISGAVADELRERDWTPRAVRRWQSESTRAGADFTALHHRRPSTAELAGALDISLAQMVGRLDDFHRTEIQSLNLCVDSDGPTAIELIDTIASRDPDGDPESSHARNEGLDRLHDALARLPGRERMIVSMLYDEDHTLREVGELVGLTESRICQIHREATCRLRADLATEQELYV